MQSALFQDLQRRGLLKACTDMALDAHLAQGKKVAVYCGFDATADSLHVGHLMSMLVLQRFAQDGHTIWPLCGTGTAMIGDPSGRSTARPLMSPETLEHNITGVEASLGRVLGDISVLRNDWLRSLNLLDFLRDVGRHLPLSKLTSLDIMRDGVSVLEAFYPLLQGYDFLLLAQRAHAQGLPLVQIGGSDQWGNICTGLELIHKADNALQAFGLTLPLLTKSDGTKMGKTAGGAVWINPERLDARAFWNFWRDVEDARVADFLALFGVHEQPLDINEAKILLANTATTLVRGFEASDQALRAQTALFAQGSIEGLPVVVIEDGDDLVAIVVKAGFAASRTRARTAIDDGAIRLNGQVLRQLDGQTLHQQRLSFGKKQHVALQAA